MSTPVVLLHPLGVDHRFWDPLRAALPEDLGPVVAPDLLGHGQAPLPPYGAGLTAFADAVEGVLDDGPVRLVGVSLGALVAQVLCARDPGRVQRLVLADTVAVYPEQMQAMWVDRAALVRERGMVPVTAPTEALWFSEAFREGRPADLHTVRDVLLGADREGYARTCEALATVDTRPLAARLTAPTLVACGRDDAPPFVAATTWLGEHLPAARTAWLPGRHATAHEHPREFAALLDDFLR